MCNGDMAARQLVRVVDFALVIFTSDIQARMLISFSNYSMCEFEAFLVNFTYIPVDSIG